MREGERKKRKGKAEGKACNLRSNDLTYLQLKKENILAMELCNPPVCSHFRSLKIICLELRKSQSHSLTCFSIFLKGVHLSETILDQLTQNSHCLLYESWNFFSPMCFIFFQPLLLINYNIVFVFLADYFSPLLECIFLEDRKFQGFLICLLTLQYLEHGEVSINITNQPTVRCKPTQK